MALRLSVVVILFAATTAHAARPLGNVVPRELAHRFGLERAWATQIELDPSRGRVAHVSLHAGLLMVQTDQAAVHVLDAETRNTLWIGHVGLAGAVTSPPTANDKYVVSTNGSVLYLFDRRTGTVLWTRKMPSVPSTGAAISKSRIYVPQVNGTVTTFRLPNPERKDETPAEQRFKDNALNYTGKGIAFQPPIVTRQSVLWGTDAGNIYSVTPDELLAVFRFKCHDSVLGSLVYREPYIYATSLDGYAYSLRDEKGRVQWQVSIGKPISHAPMATDGGVYVVPDTGGIYKLALDSGDQIWASRGVYQLLSASPTRLYTADAKGQLLILDAKSGAHLGSLATQGSSIKLFNRDNDRIYLATPTGLVQCLHEVGLKKPAWHRAFLPVAPKEPDEKEKKKKKSDEATDEPADEKPAAADGPDPFGSDEKPADGEAMEDEGK